MARNGTHSKRVAEYFAANPGETISIGKLKAGTGIGNATAISHAISYLNAKHRKGQEGGLAIETITRGQRWAYYPDRQPTRNSTDARQQAAKETIGRLAEKITAPAPGWHKVPAGEPPVSFRVIGTLMETGDLVLQGVSEGVQGVWMARRVD